MQQPGSPRTTWPTPRRPAFGRDDRLPRRAGARAAAPARASTRWTSTAGADLSRRRDPAAPGATSTWRSRATAGSPCRRWTAPRPTPAAAASGSAPTASCRRAAACRCWATAGRSACRRTPRSPSAPTAPCRRRARPDGAQRHQRRAAQAGQSRAARRWSAATTACSAPRGGDRSRPTRTSRLAAGALEEQQRQRGRHHGRHDQPRPPVRPADEDAAERPTATPSAPTSCSPQAESHRTPNAAKGRHDPLPVDLQDRPRRAADAAGRHLQQPGQRQHQRLQALARRVRGPAVPDDAPARRAVLAADAAAHRPAARHRRAPGRHRARSSRRATCSRPATRSTWRSTARASSRCRCPTAPPPTPATARFQLDAQGQLVTSSGYALQPAITIPANAQSDHHRPRRHGQRDAGRAGGADAGRPAAARELRQPGRPAEPRARTCTSRPASSGTPSTNTPGSNGVGTLQQGFVETSNVNVVEELVDMIQTQRAYEINSKADPDLRPDAAEAVAALTLDPIRESR